MISGDAAKPLGQEEQEEDVAIHEPAKVILFNVSGHGFLDINAPNGLASGTVNGEIVDTDGSTVIGVVVAIIYFVRG